MSRKGISPVIASIILILIVLAMSSAYLTFTNRLAGEQQETVQRESQELARTATSLFHIEDVRVQSVILVNDGQQTIENDTFLITLDDTRVNYTASDIAPGERGEIALNGLWQIGRGDYRLRVSTGTKSDSMSVRVESAGERALDLRFDEGSGITASDSSGNGNAGTFGPNSSAGPTWTDGRIGQALAFDGTDDYVRVADSNDLDVTRITVEAWIRPDTVAAGDARILSKDGNAYRLYRNGDQPRVIIPGLTGGDIAVPGTSLQVGVWYHVVASWDGSVIAIYQDGVLRNSQAASGSITASTNDTFIGDSESHTNRFDGTIDEVRLFNAALTPDELYVLKRR